MNTYKLKQPVEQGEIVYETLELREPTGKDVKTLGLPFTFKGDLRMDVICQYISTLAAVPPSVVDKLSAKDILQMVPILVGFFGDADGLM